jgi:tetratricopeptide (TPR) repeat protein
LSHELALESLQEAKSKWRDLLEKPLRPEIEMFFELSIGSIYENSGQEEKALAQFNKARSIK